MNWIFDMFSNKEAAQEADLTNQEKEWERKVESNDWIKDAMTIDEAELAREAAAKQAAEEDVAGVSEPFDEVGMIMAFEQGDLDNAGILRLFSELIKNGHAWSLQGSYGRAAKSLIDQGYLDEQGNILKEVDEPAAGDELQDPEMGTEREDWTASQKAKVKKIAAFTKGDTCEETIEKDYELRVKGLSDYNLAEMLSEYAAMEKGVATLSHNEYKEDAMKEVKSGRDAAEKKLVKLLGDHTLIDWKKSFKDMEESEVKHAAEKDLYSEWKEGKMAWESKTKFEATTEKEKVEQMDGVGKEEEKGQVGKEAEYQPKTGEPCTCKPGVQRDNCPSCEGTGMKIDFQKIRDTKSASLNKEAASPAEMVEKKVKELIKDKIEEAFAEAPASSPEDFPKDPLMVGEGTPEDVMMDKMKVPHLEPGETPESEIKEWKEMEETGKHPGDKSEEPVKVDDVKVEEKPEDKKDEDKEASLKIAEPVPGVVPDVTPADRPGDERGYHGWHNFETYMVGLWLDNDHALYDTVIEMAQGSADIAELSSQIKSLVEENAPDLGATVYADLLNAALSDVVWWEVAEHFEEHMNPEAPELEEPAATPEVKPEGASLQEIKPAASKKEVLQKIAEIDSPWKVVKNEKGEEIVARVAPVSTEKKSKEKDKQHGINSKDLK